jgi:CheY-like chemotaxis protein
MNLVVNARDAMPGGGEIRIETTNVDLESATGDGDQGIGPGAYVTLSVADTGVGMDERTRALIFEPFFTTKAAGKGTGLGLATVYGIVKQSGGAIAVRSQPGEGSTFTVYLPRVRAAAPQVSAGPAVERAGPGHGSILLVEDQEAVRGLVSKVLAASGYRVIEAGGGSQALALPDTELLSIDLLITDMMMPGMSGRELAARLRVRRGTLRVLFISGYTASADVRQSMTDPGVAFLQKPFSPEEITTKVDEILSAAT